MRKKPLQKLELTWIGKEDEPKLEPRILIEQPEYSYGEKDTENILIHGDNLLALKALEQEYAGRIKCIYIDPPFNTGAAFDHYDDGLEHSIWLDLMSKRLNYLHKLLSKDGSIFIHLDDNELDYLKVVCDEIFKRSNFINRITVSARSPSAFSTVNPGVFKASEYILWYAKDKTKWESRSLRIPSKRDQAYNKFIENRNLEPISWNIKPLKIAFLEELNSDKLDFIYQFLDEVFKHHSISKSEFTQFVVKSFKYDQLVNIKKLVSYLYKKANDKNIEKAKGLSYKYLLESTSYNYQEKDIDRFVFTNSESVMRETEISDSGAGQETVRLKYESIDNKGKVIIQERESGFDNIYILNGKQLSFYSKNVMDIDGNLSASKLLTNVWSDISWEGIAKEGNVKFKKGKKPEKLLQRCFVLTTNEGDFVLDSFSGSGTTAAVAHKMGRKYIGIELGNQAYTHCFKRLKDVVDGEQSGISKLSNWEGGGGFKFYTLAPSLLKKDKYDNWVIDGLYNADMLAAAMAKQEGFSYQPDGSKYWKQGNSAEEDFIYTTTQFITVETLDKIKEEMKPNESLLICCKAFSADCKGRHNNITIKKIPQMLLGRCEFGKDDYSLNIIDSPLDREVEDIETITEGSSVQEINVIEKKKQNPKQNTLFD